MRATVSIVVAAALVAGCKKKDAESSSSSPPTSGIPECEAYFTAMDKFVACDKLPPEQKNAYKSSNDKMRADMSSPSVDKAIAADQCKQAMKDLADGANARGCPL